VIIMDGLLTKLVTMSRNLGDPQKDYVILGEGNTSARADSGSFWVKASGASLQKIEASNFVQVYFERVLELLSHEKLSDAETRTGLDQARVNQAEKAVPSVETFLHAILLQLDGVSFIGHTHPTAVNSILCSNKAADAYTGSLFPDQIVYCGRAPVYVPYTDPGLPLARRVWDEIKVFIDTWNQAPKVILMQNHGLIALGKTPEEVENITAMSVKAAKVIAGTYAMGGPNFLSEENADRIQSRPDEGYRKKLWGAS